MKREAPFKASEYSPETQRFLFACAFWMASADSRLHPKELAWLADQFGPAPGTVLMQEFGALDDAGFYSALDEASRQLTALDREKLYPQLKAWLLSLAYADRVFAPAEKVLIKRILKRLGIAYSQTVKVAPKKSISVTHKEKTLLEIKDEPLSRFHAQSRIHAHPPSFLVLCSVLAIGLLGYWLLREGSATYGPVDSAGGLRTAYPGQVTFFGLVTSIASIFVYIMHYARMVIRWFPSRWFLVAGYGCLYGLCVACPVFADVAPGQGTPLDSALEMMGVLWVLLLVITPVMHVFVRRLFARFAGAENP